MPELTDDVQAQDLDKDVRAELLSLAKAVADTVARRLVAAGQTVDEDPETALAHAVAARRLASRIPVVREAVGIAAYHAGQWQTAIAELRTYHRMSGRQTHLAVLADCERALGHADRAIDIFRSVDRAQLDQAEAIELLIVASGARRDLGQDEAAVAMLQVRELTSDAPWTPRLRYAYADALLAIGRRDEAREWFSRAVEADELGETDAAERLLDLDGVTLEEAETEDDPPENDEDGPADVHDGADADDDVSGVRDDIEPDDLGGEVDGPEDVHDEAGSDDGGSDADRPHDVTGEAGSDDGPEADGPEDLHDGSGSDDDGSEADGPQDVSVEAGSDDDGPEAGGPEDLHDEAGSDDDRSDDDGPDDDGPGDISDEIEPDDDRPEVVPVEAGSDEDGPDRDPDPGAINAVDGHVDLGAVQDEILAETEGDDAASAGPPTSAGSLPGNHAGGAAHGVEATLAELDLRAVRDETVVEPVAVNVDAAEDEALAEAAGDEAAGPSDQAEDRAGESDRPSADRSRRLYFSAADDRASDGSG